MFRCGFPAYQVDDSFGYVYERENRVVLRKQANRGDRAAQFIHINQVMMARNHTLLFHLWPWMLYPVAMVTERSFLSTVVMHLFDKVVSGKVAPNPRAWETYVLGGERSVDRAQNPGGIVPHALRGNVFFADVAFILLGSVRFATAQCAERMKNKGCPVPAHETMAGLRLLQRLYLWIVGGVPNACVLRVRGQSSFRYLYATVWNRTARARQELARQLTPQDSAIAIRRSQQQRWVRNEALCIG